MSVITAAIIFIAFLGYVIFQIMKNFQLRNLNVSLQGEDYETVIQLADMPMVRRLLGDYLCDWYELCAYYQSHSTEKFEQHLKKMLQTTYPNVDDKKSFLEQYYHTFLLTGQRMYADWMLEGICALGDPLFTRYNEQAYCVMLDGRNDLIEEMIDTINSKKYYGFPLGVILFMIGKQYEDLHDDENAVIYYENAKVCFHPSTIYVPVIQKKLARLAPQTETTPA